MRLSPLGMNGDGMRREKEMIGMFTIIVILSAVLGGKWIVECYHAAFDEEEM